MRKYPFTAIPGWSFSRMETLDRCRRLYYLTYYAKRHLDPAQRDAWEALQRLQPLALSVGSIVHDEIGEALLTLRRKASPGTTAASVKRACDRLAALRSQGRLMEDHYAEGPPPSLDAHREKIRRCIERFRESKWWSWAQAVDPKRRREWVIEPDDFGEFRIDGLKAYARVDFALPHTDGFTYVLDWKTGKANVEKHRAQMKGYLLYAHDVLGVPLEKGRAVVEYLDADVEPLKLDGLSKDEAVALRDSIGADSRRLWAQCADHEENRPAPLETFPLTEDVRRCRHCQYRALCGRS